MKSMMPIFICFILFLCSPASAQDIIEPTKESFKKTWEAHIAALPTTIKFEETDTENTYLFETTLFDYNGTLKLLGIVIDENINYYYDYEIKNNVSLIGVAEVQLVDAPKEFFYDRSHSAQIWEKKQFLFYDKNQGDWLNIVAWKEAYYSQSDGDNATACSSQKSDSQSNSYRKLAIRFAPLGLFILFIIFLVVISRKQQKSYMAKYDLSMERQKEAIDSQERAMKIAVQSLELQKEQTEIMRKILEKGK